MCDALGHAAQLEMAGAIESEQAAREAAAQLCDESEAGAAFLRLADRDSLNRERAYGKWLGVRGVLRAVEGATYDFTPTELSMWQRIDWTPGLERFVFPGLEAFPELDQQGQPGADKSSQYPADQHDQADEPDQPQQETQQQAEAAPAT